MQNILPEKEYANMICKVRIKNFPPFGPKQLVYGLKILAVYISCYISYSCLYRFTLRPRA